MGINFKPSNRDQDYILPSSLKDWLPEDELAWFRKKHLPMILSVT